MKNTILEKLNFQSLLKYELKELKKIKAKPEFDPPLKCYDFCTLCETNKLIHLSRKNEPPIISHGCETDDYESFLGDLSTHLIEHNIPIYSKPIVFLLESPGSYWNSGVAFKSNGIEKQPPTKHFYWMPHKLTNWPLGLWKKPKRSGEYFGDYFAYLMVKHGLTNVYITDVIKCSWGNSYSEESRNKCIYTYLTKEVEAMNPELIFCFSRKVEQIVNNTFPNIKNIYLYHPTAISLSQRYHKSPEEMVSVNDTWISTALGNP